jgi:hypothetical protein
VISLSTVGQTCARTHAPVSQFCCSRQDWPRVSTYTRSGLDSNSPNEKVSASPTQTCVRTSTTSTHRFLTAFDWQGNVCSLSLQRSVSKIRTESTTLRCGSVTTISTKVRPPSGHPVHCKVSGRALTQYDVSVSYSTTYPPRQ